MCVCVCVCVCVQSMDENELPTQIIVETDEAMVRCIPIVAEREGGCVSV